MSGEWGFLFLPFLVWMAYRSLRDAVALRGRLACYVPLKRREKSPMIEWLSPVLGMKFPLPDWLDDNRKKLIFLVLFLAGSGGGFFLSGRLWLGVLAGLATGIVTFLFWERRRKRLIREQFLESFPGAVDSLARAISAGIPLEKALIDMGKHFPDGIAEQFSDVGRKLKLGIPLKKVLKSLMTFVNVPECDYFCTVLIINQDTGGRISAIMEQLSHSLREKHQASRQLRILTSEPRSAARIVALIPLGVLALQWVSSPEKFHFFLDDPLGKFLLLYAMLSIGAGLWIVRRMSMLR